jgi:hypothetical protein
MGGEVSENVYLAGVQMLTWLLGKAIKGQSLSSINFRVFDVLYSLDVVAALSFSGPSVSGGSLSSASLTLISTEDAGAGSGLLYKAVEIMREWLPGKYSSQFTIAAACTHPVLELSTGEDVYRS